MFKRVKTKLTLIYTISLLLLLVVFIVILHFLISKEVHDKESGDLQTFFEKEKMDFIEDLYDKKDQQLEFDQNRTIFYYVYTKDNRLAYGEESIRNAYREIEKTGIAPNSQTMQFTWRNQHLLLIKKPLVTSGYIHGFVVLGINISGETHLIQTITWTLLSMTVLFSILYALMGYYFAGQAMKPIKTAFEKQEKFVSDASHELRTPLSIFYSSIDVLTRDEKEQLSGYGKEVLEDLKAEADLMNNLINSLLFLARNDKGQLSLEMKQVNLSDLLSSIYRKFLRKESNRLKFERNIEGNVYFYCDEKRIQQLLYILLDNAFRYTKEGKVELALKVANGKKVITVTDTGCGIAEEHLPFIFDRFYRTDFSREKGGSGLGLAIAKSIVTAHGGNIFANSSIGDGTTLTIIFNKG